MSREIRLGLADLLGVEVGEVEPVAGGDLNRAYRVSLADGRHAFVKTRDGADPEEYRAEAASLAWLAAAGARTPAVIGVSEAAAPAAFLALEWIEQGRLEDAGAERLGRSLARAHRAGAEAFGARPEGAEGSCLHIGPLLLADSPTPEWPRFYAEQRLLATARIARERGSLSAEAAALIERVCARIDELAGPAEPPARLHGDLWSGNVMADATGEAVLVDPAGYGGHREVDLAMLRLFGSPGERIFSAYEEEWPLAPGAPERVGLWQLFPLLVHAALFGSGWADRAVTVARRYA